MRHVRERAPHPASATAGETRDSPWTGLFADHPSDREARKEVERVKAQDWPAFLGLACPTIRCITQSSAGFLNAAAFRMGALRWTSGSLPDRSSRAVWDNSASAFSEQSGKKMAN